MAINRELQQIGFELINKIKFASWFPYKSGKLKFEATSGQMVEDNVFRIKFDSSVAPYVQYLEEGTAPHDIPFAFVGSGNWKWWYPYDDNVPFLFGTGGRFNGKFHPGSTIHQGFISDKCIKEIINYLVSEYQGELRE